MPYRTTQLKIGDDEYRQRGDRLQAYLSEQGLDGAVLFDRSYILYYSDFAFIPTERPMALVVSAAGEMGMFVPRLEAEHAEANALVGRVAHYPEYPGETHPMQVLADLLREMGIGQQVGVDDNGYPWILGYRGPSISELTGGDVTTLRPFIEHELAIKSPTEIALIFESVRWGNLAHTLLQRYTRPGVTETEVSQRASDEATRAMLDAIGPIYRAQSDMGMGGAFAGYRGQIGRNAAIPHALANNITFQAGDVLVTGAAAGVWGYTSELERTMIIGEPTDEQRRLFDHMLALQETAFDALKPGARCAEVDRAVRAYYEEHDLTRYWKHHSGHAIGLRYHEGPFLDTGDDTVIEPGMVFTVEPGLYAPEVGGFRHSDTVLITESGAELLTYYPRDLASLTLPT